MPKYHHPYGAGSKNSYFMDLAHYSLRDGDEKQARERLLRHADDLELTDEGRTLRTIENTINRTEDEQRVGVTSSSTSDGVFVVPHYLVEEGDFFRGYQSALIPQCVQVPDTGYGTVLAIPTLTATSSTAQQALPTVGTDGTAQQTSAGNELSGASDSAPSGSYQTAAIGTFVGEVPLSIQAYERSGPKPYTLDRIIALALRDSLQTTLGQYAFSQVVASAGITTGAGSYAANTFQQDCAKAQSQILTASGVKMPASHAFTSPTLAQWLLAQSDTGGGRPLLTPHLNGAPSQVRLQDYQGAAVGYTGTELLGSHFFYDGTTPNQAGSATLSQIIFADANELFWTMSPPAIRCIGEAEDGWSGSGTLTVLLQYYAYASLVVRRSGAVQALNAAYLLDAPTFS